MESERDVLVRGAEVGCDVIINQAPENLVDDSTNFAF